MLTGLHALIDLVESFIESDSPLNLQYSALFEPAFRLLVSEGWVTVTPVKAYGRKTLEAFVERLTTS